MMHAVIRSSNDTIHLIGHVDAYNVESLRDHVRGMGRHGHVWLTIEIDPADRTALQRHAGRWLGRLAGADTTVAIRAGAQPITLQSRDRAA